MYYVYIIKSDQDDFLYLGSTKDLRRRLANHNAGEVTSTKHCRPFSLRYYEAYYKESDARAREKSLKKDGRGAYVLKQRIRASLQWKYGCGDLSKFLR